MLFLNVLLTHVEDYRSSYMTGLWTGLLTQTEGCSRVIHIHDWKGLLLRGTLRKEGEIEECDALKEDKI